MASALGTAATDGQAPVRNGQCDEGLVGEIVELVFRLGGRLRSHFEDRCGEFELSPPQAMALSQLDRPMPMRQLAQGLKCDASNITAIVDRLEERGLVERQVDSADRRIKKLVVTAKGEALRRRMRERVFDGVPVVAGLTAQQQGQLRDLLRTVVGP
jgi:DNA-binding MarR family transcriptional regulator